MKFSKKVMDSNRTFKFRKIVRQSDINTEGLTTAVMLGQHSLDQHLSWLDKNKSLRSLNQISEISSKVHKVTSWVPSDALGSWVATSDPCSRSAIIWKTTRSIEVSSAMPSSRGAVSEHSNPHNEPHKNYSNKNKGNQTVKVLCLNTVNLTEDQINKKAVSLHTATNKINKQANRGESNHGKLSAQKCCCAEHSVFSCVCLMASMARSVNCHGQKNAVQVHLIGAKPIVQVKRWNER